MAKTTMQQQEPAGTAQRTYAGRRVSERSSERRRSLLDAALDLFCRDGYANTRVEPLCAAAGISTRQFYELFGDREQVLREVLDDITRTTQEAVVKALAEPAGSPTEQVVAALRAFIRHYLQDPRRARLAGVEVVGVSAAMEKHRRRIIHDWARIIESHALALEALGELPPADYRLTAIALVGAVNEVMVDCITNDAPATIEAVEEALVGMFKILVGG